MTISHKRIKVTAETELPSLLAEAARKPLILDHDGKLFRLEPENPLAFEPDRERVLRTLEATVGIVPDPDGDAAIAAVYAARQAGSRPPDRPDLEMFRHEDGNSIDYEPDAEAIRRMLAEPAGIFADMDVDAEIAAVYEARRAGSRPPDRP